MNKRVAWVERFEEASDEISGWRVEYPKASFTDIENSVDEQLGRVRAQMIQDLALESELTDIKALRPEKRPKCPGCERPLVANGRQQRTLITRHEQRVELERSKGYCRDCRASYFPPG